MPSSRSIPASQQSISYSRSSSCRYGWLLVLLMCVGVCRAEDCDGPSPSVVAVASVFTTLAVVAIVLVVAYVLLRRRNAGFLFPPQRARKSADLSPADANTSSQLACYDNPLFSGHDAKAAEEGRARSSPKKTSGNKSPTKAENQKTWVSLPGQNDSYPDGLHRQGSCGSLDNNYMGPATTSVWLQSQDIIGLGFNICGNMRDGIFVSQVHNRGPAVESGKIKVGDRIVSVTIAYDNIVYEDALTILSYASPYPVKVTLLKERAVGADTRSGPGNEQLNHPLYRSQSLDALQRIGKDNPFRGKRAQSEMKTETRTNSPRKNRVSASVGNERSSSSGAGEEGAAWPGKKDRKSKGVSKGFSSDFADFSPATMGKVDVSSDVMVHAAETVDGKISPGGEFQPAQEVVKAVKGASSESAPQRALDGDPEDGRGPKSGVDAEDAINFASMMDQMMDSKPSGGGGEGIVESQTSSSQVSASPRARPNKPERKKKSSGSSLSFDDPEQLFGGVEETVQAVKAVTAHAIPNRKEEEDLGPEVEEELIQPSVAKREVIIGSDNIQFVPREKREDEEAVRSRSPSPLAFTSTSSGNSRFRPVSPEGDPVEEELIEAAEASKDALSAPLPRSSRSREVDGGRDKKKQKDKAEKEKEKKKPPIADEELERLIAMNAFPPGTQGWAGINAGGRQGGIHDDFVPRDLAQQAIIASPQHNQHQRSGSSSSEASSSQSQSSRSQRSGGVAFEVRDDVVTGRPMSVEIPRSRNSSASPSRSGSGERGDWPGRATSPRDELLQKQQQKHQQKHQHQLRQQRGRAEDKENNREDDGLDWSGKRLVRSGSFPEIPQDDSISDWTDKNIINDDDDNDNDVDDDFSSTSGKRSNADANLESDSEADHTAPRVLPTRNIFQARENLANMSDLSNSMSSSRSSSPPAAGVVTSNGPAVGLGIGEDGFTSIDLDSTSDANANSKKRVSVTLNADIEDDMDC